MGMTIKSRENLVLLYLLVAAAALVIAAGSLWVLFSDGLKAQAAAFPYGAREFRFALFAAGICGAHAVGTLTVLAFRAGKSASIELFFLALFSLGLGLEAGRLFMPWLMAQGAGLYTLGMVSKIVLFGRYLSILSLFMGSLFAIGLAQERLDFVLGAAFLVAAFFTSIHPLNTSVMGSSLVVELGYARLVRMFESLMLAICFVNYLVAWKERRDRAFLLAGLGSAAIAVSAYILRGNPSHWSYLALVPLLLGGTWLHVKSMYAHYLWR